MKEKFAKLIDLKSIITLIMVITLVAVLFSDLPIDSDFKTLFCTSFGMVMTYYFTRTSTDKKDK